MTPGRALRRRRVLIVNCYLDDSRTSVARRRKIPAAMGPPYLAGALARERCDIRLWCELHAGPLEDERLLAWPEMLVLTGLTTALDRMRQVAAYARTKNPRVVVVAGGHAVRALPRYCSAFFDYCCQGDVEELGAVADEVFGQGHAAVESAPRFDLAPWLGRIAYLESSRNCNFRCSFCVLTAEDRRYRAYGLPDLQRHLAALGRRDCLVFIDNNFYGNDRKHFLARLALLRERWRAGQFRGWGALVTNDFFFDEANLEQARAAGCYGLFSGLESLDRAWLARHNKVQNTRLDPVELVARTLRAGIGFSYGLVFDLTTRRLAEVRRELEFILSCPEIPLPAYVSMAIPMLKTPFFYACLRDGAILPRTRIRDLDSSTVSLRPLDPLDEAATLVRELQGFRAYRTQALRHTVAFTRRHGAQLPGWSLAVTLMNATRLCFPNRASGARRRGAAGGRRTFVSTTDVLDPSYTPAFAIDPRHARCFEPTYLTDAGGELSPALAPDLASPPARAPELRVG